MLTIHLLFFFIFPIMYFFFMSWILSNVSFPMISSFFFLKLKFRIIVVLVIKRNNLCYKMVFNHRIILN